MASIRRRSPWRVVVGKDSAGAAMYPTKKQAEAAAELLAAAGGQGIKVERASGGSWEARIRCKLAPDLVKTFKLKTEAEQWVREREGEIVKRQFVDYREADRKTLGDLLKRFNEDRLAAKPKSDPDRVRIRQLCRHPIALIRMSALQPADIAEYRDGRLKGESPVKGTTVKKELEMMSRVINVARQEWRRHLAQNPASGTLVPRPEKQDGGERDRRLADLHVAVASKPKSDAPLSGEAGGRGAKRRRKHDDDAFENDPDTDALLQMPQTEQQALLRACRYPTWFTQRKREVTAATLKARQRRAAEAPVKARLRPGCRIWAVTSFAIETAMRRRELSLLRWSHVHLAKGYLDLPGPITKNKKQRLVPLTPRARRILATQPRVGELVFNVTTNMIMMAFGRARERVGSLDLRLHDLRHEATSRLFERTDLRATEIGSITGHTDPRMLALLQQEARRVRGPIQEVVQVSGELLPARWRRINMVRSPDKARGVGLVSPTPFGTTRFVPKTWRCLGECQAPTRLGNRPSSCSDASIVVFVVVLAVKGCKDLLESTQMTPQRVVRGAVALIRTAYGLNRPPDRGRNDGPQWDGELVEGQDHRPIEIRRRRELCDELLECALQQAWRSA